MRENNSVSLALELLQLFCKNNTSPPWTAKVYTRSYHRLIWRLSEELQTVRVATALRRRVFPAKWRRRLDAARRLQRIAHRVDRWFAIEPDGKRKCALVQQH